MKCETPKKCKLCFNSLLSQSQSMYGLCLILRKEYNSSLFKESRVASEELGQSGGKVSAQWETLAYSLSLGSVSQYNSCILICSSRTKLTTTQNIHIMMSFDVLHSHFLTSNPFPFPPLPVFLFFSLSFKPD